MMLMLAGMAPAQDTVQVPLAATFGPVRVTPGQTLRVCVNHFFNNSLVNSRVRNKPLVVVIAYVDAINGVPFEPAKELTLALTKGACEEYRAPESQPDATAMVLLAPLSQEDSKQFSTELLPVCSATLYEGSGAQARLMGLVPMVPKGNLLIPRGRR